MTVTIVDVARPVTGGVDVHLEANVAPGPVTGGVDTHLDLNVAAVLDGIGGLLAGVSRHQLAARAAALRPDSREGADPVIVAAKTALRILGRRVLALDAEKARIDALLAGLVTQTAPQLLAVFGVGTDTAAALLVTAGDNPGRLRSAAAWAHLCGTAPIPASSGKVTRYRLNRGGDRQANRALWGIVFTRLRNDPRTKAYMDRRLGEGRSKPEAIRILKRYAAREVYHHLPRT